MKKILWAGVVVLCTFVALLQISRGQGSDVGKRQVRLASSKLLLEPVPGSPQQTNSFPAAMAVSPDKRYIAVLNNGWGTKESEYAQSIAILDTQSAQSQGFDLQDFPDARLKAKKAHQSYFYGIAFSSDGRAIYASMGSTSDPEGSGPGNTGNGVAVYTFSNGKVAPERFIKIKAGPQGAGKRSQKGTAAPRKVVPFPAELAVVRNPKSSGDLLLVANNLSDDAVLLDAQSGNVVHRFDLSVYAVVPGSFPYGVAVTADGKTGYVSLWNASRVAELDLTSGKVTRMIPLRVPAERIKAGSHPTALLLSADEKTLYVALANTDEVAVIERSRPASVHYLDTRLPGRQQGGSYPIGLALSEDGKMLFAAVASCDAVAVFDLTSGEKNAMGFVPAEWYPTAVRSIGGGLFILAGKGKGPGSNVAAAPSPGTKHGHSYIASLLYGSVARVPVADLRTHLHDYTEEVMTSNLMRGNTGQIAFKQGGNRIRHVIYVIKENRTYDQILGDLGVGDGDASLTMYGEDITPNQHKLARQFGVLDNFYDSGEVSGDGHVWSTAAITSDYNEKTWQIDYRDVGGSVPERSYDYEGWVEHGMPLEQGIPDVNEPGTGYLWANFSRHGISYRHYGEFVTTIWCKTNSTRGESPTEGTPEEAGQDCSRGAVKKGEKLPENLGRPKGGPSPWPWDVPLPAKNVAAKAELRGHFDPRFPDFKLEFPDQLRADEFLNEFSQFVEAKKSGKGAQMSQFVLLRLGNDHTSAKKALKPSPSAAIADNDLALGRVVEAVSHSPYWDDTAICVLEDDAQDGVDHVDAHRSIAFVISKYAPRHASDSETPFVDHSFYTTVNMVHTIEALLGAPPMNNNDARAALMAPLFSGAGDQPAFDADGRNQENGLIYQMNPASGPGAAASALLDFSHADAADATALNAILWRDRMGDRPLPQQQHRVFAH